MPKLPPKAATAAKQAKERKPAKPDCVACGGSRLNSRGGVCYPCLKNGRVKIDGPYLK